jgi:hypothetical protein
VNVPIYSINEKVLYSLNMDIRLSVLLGLDKLQVPEGIAYFSIPYTLTEGRDEGLTTRWEATIDYNIGSGLTASATYSGRHISSGIVPPYTIHSGRAEIRATF